MKRNIYYLVNEIDVVAIKKIVINKKSFITIIDAKTDGLKISYSIQGNFSLKNIELELSKLFKTFVKQAD